MHEDLVAQAEILANLDAKKPKQAWLQPATHKSSLLSLLLLVLRLVLSPSAVVLPLLLVVLSLLLSAPPLVLLLPLSLLSSLLLPPAAGGGGAGGARSHTSLWWLRWLPMASASLRKVASLAIMYPRGTSCWSRTTWEAAAAWRADVRRDIQRGSSTERSSRLGRMRGDRYDFGVAQKSSKLAKVASNTMWCFQTPCPGRASIHGSMR